MYEKRIRKIIIPIIEVYEMSVPDILAICKYKVNKDVTRIDITRALMPLSSAKGFLYAPHYDTYRPRPKDRYNRIEYITILPRLLRRLIVAENRAEAKRGWKREHIYLQYADDVRKIK